MNLAIPFIDHILANIKEPFTGLSAVYGRLIGLVPTIQHRCSTGARCSSVVRAFAHGAMGHRIDPS